METKSVWKPKTIYLYLVCLITLVMVIVSTVSVVRSLVELAYPEPDLSSPAAPQRLAPDGGAVPEETPEQRQLRRDWAIRSTVLSLTGNLAMLLVAGPLYVYHWRKVRQVDTSERLPESQA